ncbi:hypothetical protein JYT26_01580 [Beggiatoa alba]|nr:hypothetical protein [Beggiatoa alba]
MLGISLCFTVIVMLAACGGGGTDSSGDTGTGTGGISVNAVSDQTLNKRTATTLDGSGSSPNGSISYSWTQLSGVTVSLSDPLIAQPSLTSPGIAGQLVFQLSASDGKNVVTDTIILTVINRVPVANAGSTVSANGDETVTLGAMGSSDPDGDRLIYTWSQTAGTAVNFNDIHASQPSFVAPSSNDEPLSFALTVSDGEAPAGPVFVSVTNLAYTGSRVSWQQNPMMEHLSLEEISETLVVGSLAYIASGSNGLQIFNVSDPDNVTLVGSYSEMGWNCNQIAVSGNIAILAGGLYPSEIRIIDISTPASPTKVMK